MEEHRLEDRDMLVEDLLKMLERGSPNDVKIKLKDGEIAANKDILMARSDYFATMFSNNIFIEGGTDSVDMSHCSKAVMGKIIKFLFSGAVQFEDLALDQLLELSHMSDMMLLPKIKAQVDDYVVYRVKSLMIRENMDLFVSGFKLVEQYKLSNLKTCFIRALHCGLLVVKLTNEAESFKTLPFNLIKDIFLFLPVELANPPTTNERLEAFMVWLSANEASLEQKNQIVDSFDFEDFTVQELMTSIRDSGLYSTKKIDERVLNLFKNQEDKIKEQDLKINELKDTLQEAKMYIPSFQLYRFRS